MDTFRHILFETLTGLRDRMITQICTQSKNRKKINSFVHQLLEEIIIVIMFYSHETKDILYFNGYTLTIE